MGSKLSSKFKKKEKEAPFLLENILPEWPEMVLSEIVQFLCCDFKAAVGVYECVGYKFEHSISIFPDGRYMRELRQTPSQSNSLIQYWEPVIRRKGLKNEDIRSAIVGDLKTYLRIGNAGTTLESEHILGLDVKNMQDAHFHCSLSLSFADVNQLFLRSFAVVYQPALNNCYLRVASKNGYIFRPVRKSQRPSDAELERRYAEVLERLENHKTCVKLDELLAKPKPMQTFIGFLQRDTRCKDTGHSVSFIWDIAHEVCILNKDMIALRSNANATKQPIANIEDDPFEVFKILFLEMSQTTVRSNWRDTGYSPYGNTKVLNDCLPTHSKSCHELTNTDNTCRPASL